MSSSTTRYYSEWAIALRAPLFTLPVPFIVVAWERFPDGWWRALILWLVASFLAYQYGHWVRDDED